MPSRDSPETQLVEDGDAAAHLSNHGLLNTNRGVLCWLRTRCGTIEEQSSCGCIKLSEPVAIES